MRILISGTIHYDGWAVGLELIRGRLVQRAHSCKLKILGYKGEITECLRRFFREKFREGIKLCRI